MNSENEKQSLRVDEMVRVKMVDFAHVLEKKDSLDENYLFGLTNLISFLKCLLDDNYTYKDVRHLKVKNK